MRTHLEAVQRQTGKVPKELAAIPEMPQELVYIWIWFCELDAARGGNGFGMNPISFSEVHAWATLTGNALQPWEVATLRRFDSVRIRVASEK